MGLEKRYFFGVKWSPGQYQIGVSGDVKLCYWGCMLGLFIFFQWCCSCNTLDLFSHTFTLQGIFDTLDEESWYPVPTPGFRP